MSRRVLVPGKGIKRVAVNLDKLGGAALGENIYYNGVLLDPKLVLNSFAQAQQVVSGDSTTDTVYEGHNLYFTTERAQDAAAAMFVDSDGITWVYDDDNNTLTGTLTPTGVTADTYGDAANVVQLVIGDDGRIYGATNIPIAAGGAGTIIARLATVTALPANTYANGTSGVGATLTASSNGVLTVDSKTVALNDIVLVDKESNQAHNGVYQCTQAGAAGAHYILTRISGMDDADEFTGALVAVGPDGTVNANTLWQCSAVSPVTVGTTAITFGRPGSTQPRLEVTFVRPLGDIQPGDYGTVNSAPACNLTGYRITAKSSGSIQIDVRVHTWSTRPSSGDSITAGNYIALSGADEAEVTSLSSWSSTALPAGSRLEFYVVSCTGIQDAKIEVYTG